MLYIYFFQDIDAEFKESFTAPFNVHGKSTLEDSFKNIDSIPSLLKVATTKNKIQYVFKVIFGYFLWSGWKISKHLLNAQT